MMSPALRDAVRVVEGELDPSRFKGLIAQRAMVVAETPLGHDDTSGVCVDGAR